ncbi:MAG: glycosyltransferase family 4 protein [Calditrichaeota bacterium]|nr:glycosyltransferase family 4 protein [Calditrichota bacterium]
MGDTEAWASKCDENSVWLLSRGWFSMKIAYLLPNLHITGGARSAVELGGRMMKRGHEFNILIPSGRKKLNVAEGINVIECGWKVSSPLLAVPTGLLGMLQKMPPADIVIGSMPTHSLTAKFIGNRMGIPAVNYVLGNDVHFFDDNNFLKSSFLVYLYKLIAKFAIKSKYMITNSHQTAVWLVSEGGNRPCAIVNSGYNPELFFPSSDKRLDRQAMRLITIGKKQPAKGFPDLIDALNMVDQKECQFTLVVVSQDNLDMSSAKFNFQIEKPQSDVELANLYRSGDIYINSSWSEGFGLPSLEAQACGLAIVSTNCGGVREFLKDGENSLIVPPREPLSLCRAIERLIKDNKQRSRLIEAGLKSCQKFTWEVVSAKFETILKEIKADFTDV